MKPGTNKILNFVRIDGKSSAPVLFLTTEDGGKWKDEELATHDSFWSCFEKEEWVPEPGHNVKLGRPGTIIPKLMTSIFGGNLESWWQYRNRHIYRTNECNIKFYPIGRPSTTYWKEKFSTYIECSQEDYYEYCLAVRPRIILNRIPNLTAKNRLIIVLSSKGEWQRSLSAISDEIDRVIQVPDARGKVAHQIFLSGERICYAYFNMFRRGLFDKDICTFAETIRSYVPSEIFDKVSLGT